MGYNNRRQCLKVEPCPACGRRGLHNPLPQGARGTTERRDWDRIVCRFCGHEMNQKRHKDQFDQINQRARLRERGGRYDMVF